MSQHDARAPAILVTGVGGGVGQSIIKALQGTEYRIVGVDSHPLAVGLHATQHSYLGRTANDPRYIDRLIEIARIEGCALIFPGHDVELGPIAASAARFTAEGIIPVVSTPEVVDTCDDKLATYAFLNAHGFAVPKTFPLLSTTTMPEYPVVLKPRRGGARSKDTYAVRTAEAFATYRALVDPENCVVQEYIEGDEYTCGTVTLGDQCVGPIVMRRILRAGDTYKAFVEHDATIESIVRESVTLLKPFGACNVQLRIRQGTPYIFEFNARCSGTTAARALAGFNEPLMIAYYLLRGKTPSYTIEEISVLRYWKELVVRSERIEALERTGSISGEGTIL